MNDTHELWREMAGTHYLDVFRSKEGALARLSDPNANVRIAAIHICESHWNCSAEHDFLVKCRVIAQADDDESVRVQAISVLGNALQSSKDRSTSEFLATIITSDKSSEKLRMAAYWALRAVQFGICDEDLISQSVSLIKELLRKHAKHLCKSDVEKFVFRSGIHAEVDSNAVGEIDWEFVHAFAP